MIAPYKWLSDYVELNTEPEEIMNKLIMTGSTVDGYKELGSDIKNVVVGKIDSITKHPDADKLSVCMVDIGDDHLQIVCGANNIFEGAFVPVAKIGALLPGGLKIHKGKLRGIFSNGMLCSGSELGLGASDYPGAEVDGILILQEGYPLGTPLREILDLTDTVFEIEVGANRPDCLSILGVARECAASLEKTLTLPDLSYPEAGGRLSDYLRVEVKDTDLCERYVARAVKNVRIGPSPKWMRERLMAAGVRSINNIVDITNFVMLETGQPMHAFDYNDIRGKEIIVRRAKIDETITTLDDKERELNEEMLLICDADGSIGIAGVMGGQNSEIKDDTSTVIFESAKFAQGNIRRTSRSLGLPTESSMRFSKGIDTAGCKTAMDRALHLVTLLDAGDIVSGEIDILSADLSPRQVTVSAKKINKILGTSIDPALMAALLRRVFIDTQLIGDTLVCSIPSFRGDIKLGEDIAEEVARMYGYDRIPVVKMTGEIIRGTVTDQEKAIDLIRNVLVSLGCYECVTYSFASLADPDKMTVSNDDPLRRLVKIINPLGDEQGYMRTSLIPEMLKVVANNLNRKSKEIRLFESGRVYFSNSEYELPEEKKYICIALCGNEDFYTLKGILENLFDAFGIKNQRCALEGPPYFHPGRKAAVFSGQVRLGQFGEIHPDVVSAFGVSRKVYIAEISLDSVCRASDMTIRYEALPKYPAVERDLALIVDNHIDSASLFDCITKNAGSSFESASLFDVYTGAPLEPGKKSLAYSIVFRAKDRTLLDEEANKSIDSILLAAKNQFGAKIRE